MELWAWLGPTLAIGIAFLVQGLVIGKAKRDQIQAIGSNGMDKDTAVDIRRYHNDRIYYNFELFMKLMFAVAGGLGFLAINRQPITGGFASLELPSMLVVGASGFLIAWLILLHEARKIGTSHRRIGSAWLIGDRYMYFGLVLITSLMVWVFLPGVFEHLEATSGRAPSTASALPVPPNTQESLIADTLHGRLGRDQEHGAPVNAKP